MQFTPIDEGGIPLAVVGFPRRLIPAYLFAFEYNKDEVKYPVRFYDVGAVIFVAKACVWNFPDFSVETHFDKLFKIQCDIEDSGYYRATGGRFLLASRKIQ